MMGNKQMATTYLGWPQCISLHGKQTAYYYLGDGEKVISCRFEPDGWTRLRTNTGVTAWSFPIMVRLIDPAGQLVGHI